MSESDGIIIARGYLGLDLKLEDVAYVQKYLIKKCNLAGKPVILSTQIMESMVQRLRPTRAEVSDISNAVNSLWLIVIRFMMVLIVAYCHQKLILAHSGKRLAKL